MIVFSAGCTDLDNPLNTKDGSQTSSALEVTKLDTLDDSLITGQSTQLNLVLKNHHTQETEINDISIYNTGDLVVEDEDWRENCSPDEIRRARNSQQAPRMECNFDVEAPTEDQMEGFRDKKFNPRARITYTTSMVNEETPVSVVFKPENQIESIDRHTTEFSNGEILATVRYDSPAVSGESTRMDVEIGNNGPGDLADLDDEGTKYEITISPDRLLSDKCGSSTKLKPPEGEHGVLECTLEGMEVSSQSTRGLTFDIGYKYQLSPKFSVAVRNNE